MALFWNHVPITYSDAIKIDDASSWKTGIDVALVATLFRSRGRDGVVGFCADER